MHRPLSLGLAAVSALLTAAPASLPAAPPAATAPASRTFTAHYEGVLGTSLDLRIRAASPAQAARAQAAMVAEFDRQSAILSAWDSASEFSRWQRTRNVAIPVSQELLATLARFDYWQQHTAGLLNPAVADAAHLWQNAALTGQPPTAAALAASAARMAQPHWRLDAIHGTATRLSASPLVLASFVKSRISAAAAVAALRSGATGVMLNVGGDIVLRGDLAERIDIANAADDSDNSAPLDTVLLRGDRAIATSGGYRRNIALDGDTISHLIDPRSGRPANAALSSSVVAADPEHAGALATALAIASPSEARALLRDFPTADALVVYHDGTRLQTPGWARLQEPRLDRVAFHALATSAAAPNAAAWNQNFDLTIKLDIPRIDDPRYRRPYIAVWIEDENKYPVRTVALWFQKPKWLNELHTWYRDDRLRNLTEGTDISASNVSSATRAPGAYTLKWDGKDNDGKLVKPGKYTVCIEGAREHGGYGLSRYPMDFNGTPQQTTLPAQPEIGAVQLIYAKK